MKTKSNWKWYGVKIIKQIIVTGEPDQKLVNEASEKYGLEYVEDGNQDFEESIMLVKAQSFEHAYKIAEKKSSDSSSKYTNIFGQEVEWRFLEAVDCFEIIDELKSGTEVYSCFLTADKAITAEDFLKNWYSCSDEGIRKARHL